MLSDGGETGSTEVKKLELHAEVLAARKTDRDKHKRRRLRVRRSRLSGCRSSGYLLRSRPERRLSKIAFGEMPAEPKAKSSRLVRPASCPWESDRTRMKMRDKHVGA